MKRILFAGASLFALMAGSASAATTTFGYTGTIAYYTVPLAGEYQVITYGAQGGNGGTIGGGGRGAKIGADFSLGAGDVLEIVVGVGERVAKTAGAAGAAPLSSMPAMASRSSSLEAVAGEPMV